VGRVKLAECLAGPHIVVIIFRPLPDHDENGDGVGPTHDAHAQQPLTIDRRNLLLSAAAASALALCRGFRVVNASTLPGRPNHCHRHPLAWH